MLRQSGAQGCEDRQSATWPHIAPPRVRRTLTPAIDPPHAVSFTARGTDSGQVRLKRAFFDFGSLQF